MIKTFGINKLGSALYGASAGNILSGDPRYRIVDDGTTKVRFGIRDCCEVRDITLTELGFAGTEYIDWENQITLPLS